MKIIIDARLINESGIGRYLRNLLSNLQDLDRTNEYYILLLKKDFGIKLNENFKKIELNFRWYTLQEQIKLPGILNKIKPDLVHFPHFNVPIFYKGKFIVTIHDLIHQHHGMRRASKLDPFTFKLKQLGYNKVFSAAVKKSVKVLTPSNFVKNQLIDEWQVNKNKIIVTPEAVDDTFYDRLKMSSEKVNLVMEKFNIKLPFIFYVGNAHPHKNVEGLIRAFGELRKRHQYMQLVLAGSDHYFWERLKKEFNQEGIIYTGFVTDEELVALYKNAKCFVMPSFEEGFGIPILEAFACSCPVVSSNGGSLLEIGRDAALYFDPKNIDDMVEKITQVLDDENLRKDLIKNGQRRVKEFNWKNLSKQTLGVYKSV